MSKVYVSSVHIKKHSVKTPRHPRHFTYKENKSKYAHESVLPYITWGLIQDTKKREREPLEFQKEEGENHQHFK